MIRGEILVPKWKTLVTYFWKKVFVYDYYFIYNLFVRMLCKSINIIYAYPCLGQGNVA